MKGVYVEGVMQGITLAVEEVEHLLRLLDQTALAPSGKDYGTDLVEIGAGLRRLMGRCVFCGTVVPQVHSGWAECPGCGAV